MTEKHQHGKMRVDPPAWNWNRKTPPGGQKLFGIGEIVPEWAAHIERMRRRPQKQGHMEHRVKRMFSARMSQPEPDAARNLKKVRDIAYTGPKKPVLVLRFFAPTGIHAALFPEHSDYVAVPHGELGIFFTMRMVWFGFTVQAYRGKEMLFSAFGKTPKDALDALAKQRWALYAPSASWERLSWIYKNIHVRMPGQVGELPRYHSELFYKVQGDDLHWAWECPQERSHDKGDSL